MSHPVHDPSLRALTDFGLGILRHTPLETNVLSPLSIAVALAVVFSASKKETQSEISVLVLNGSFFPPRSGSSVDDLGQDLEAKCFALASMLSFIPEAKIVHKTR